LNNGEKNTINSGPIVHLIINNLQLQKRLSQNWYSLLRQASKISGTANFKQILDIFNNLPFMLAKPFDLDQYVTDGALSRLFLMMGKEETKIRIDPTARATDLLKKFFPDNSF
jgi:hypothetical protein